MTMAGFYSLENKEVIRVKVKKCDGPMQPEYKKFSIDPQITTFDMLLGILGKAFEIKRDFSLSYLARDAEGRGVYLSMLSDWDMDAAFQCAAEPCLKLKIDLTPFDQDLDDWDVIAPVDVPQQKITSAADKSSLFGSITSHVGKTVFSVQRVMGFKVAEETHKPLKPAMSDQEFHNYLDSAGFMVKPGEFRLSIYQGGIEASLRRVAWRHLLNIFPENISGRERFDYLKHKEQEYYSLRDEWKERFAGGSTTEEVKYVASMVKKDVLRTDRAHRMYAGDDDNKNVQSLFHILVTYALTHPDVSYCQGMSDLASPLLVIQKDEAQAYICFCSLMNRLHNNFSPDGMAMMTQFRHLAELLKVHDEEYYEYLQSINAHDLFFCYRWFLLQLKREFPFEDALYMLEVMWSTLPPAPPKEDLPLVDPDYNVRLLSSSPCSPTFSFQQSVYAKLLAMRCSSRAKDFSTPCPNTEDSVPQLPQTDPTENAQSSVSDVPPAEEDQDLNYHQVDRVRASSVHQRSDRHERINTFIIPFVDEYNTEETEGQEARQDVDGHISTQDVETVDTQCNHSENFIMDGEDGGQNSPPAQHTLVFQQWAASDPECSGMCQTTGCPVADSVECLRDTEQSTETFSSFVNISVDLGKPGLSQDLGSSFDCCSPKEDNRDEQFSLSMESNPEVQNQNSPESNLNRTVKKDSEDEGYSGFFGNVKKLLVSPKKQPSGLVLQQGISTDQNSCSQSSTSSKDQAVSEDLVQRGQSDSGVSEGLGDGEASGSWSSSQASKSGTRPQPPAVILPPPQDFGNGNPFLMFMCLTLLLQHREQIMGSHMDYEDVAMFFDKMVRRHNVHKVLHQARHLYSEYLRTQQTYAEQSGSEDFGLSL